MENKSGKNSKQLILDAAMEVFAEKGFDGSRVDEIAKRAQVNKALIYYYFESKDKILEELMVGLVREMVNLRDQLNKEQDKLDIKEFLKSPIIDDYAATLFDFNKQHSRLLKIIMIEALKNDESQKIFFQMLNLITQEGVEKAKSIYNETSLIELEIIGVFFSFIPMLNFIQFGEKWAEYNQLDYQMVQEKYFSFYKNLFTGYLTGPDKL